MKIEIKDYKPNIMEIYKDGVPVAQFLKDNEQSKNFVMKQVLCKHDQDLKNGFIFQGNLGINCNECNKRIYSISKNNVIWKHQYNKNLVIVTSKDDPRLSGFRNV